MKTRAEVAVRRGYADSDGWRIAYQASGAGPAFVCCHAMGWDHSMWDAHRAAFSRDYQLITFDQRGAGDSDHPPFANTDNGAYSVAAFGNDLAAVLDHLGIEKARVLGYSMGAVAALSFATRWPQRVERLVLASAMASRLPDEIIARARVVEQMVDTRGLDETYEFYFSGPLFEALKSSPTFQEHMGSVRAKATPDGFKGCFRVTIDRPSLIADLSKIQAPSLIIVGARDTHYLAEADLLAAAIPRASKLVMDDAGHTLAMQRPAAFEQAVLTFLA